MRGEGMREREADHFDGEPCTRYPAWIQGALESGVRAALEVLTVLS